MARNGYRAIDIGHIDVEYECFRKRVAEKIPIEGKYVNEGLAYGDRSGEDIELSEYKSQVMYSFV